MPGQSDVGRLLKTLFEKHFFLEMHFLKLILICHIGSLQLLLKLCPLAQAACMRHKCLRVPCLAWPLLSPSFSLSFFLSLSSVFCFWPTSRNLIFGRFFFLLQPAFGHGRLGHPQSLEYSTMNSTRRAWGGGWVYLFLLSWMFTGLVRETRSQPSVSPGLAEKQLHL